MPPRTEKRHRRDDDPIAEQLESVAVELRVIRDVLDEFRTQIHWLATNGIPRWQPSIDDRDSIRLSADLHQQDPRTKSATQSRESELVREVIERLETGIASIATDQLALFVDALDGVRDELVAALKRDPQQSLPFDQPADDSPVPPQPVLETGATEITQRSQPDTGMDVTHDAPPQRSLFGALESAAVPSTLFEAGEAVRIHEFDADGSDGFGEIVTVDDAYNTATVQLVPSEEHVTVSQDLLTKVEPDPLAASPADTPSRPV